MIRFEKVTKTFWTAAGEICALSEIDLNIEKGCIFGVIGSSGAGKSTLLHVIGGLDKACGDVIYDDVNILKKRSSIVDDYRNEHIGYIPKGKLIAPGDGACEGKRRNVEYS